MTPDETAARLWAIVEDMRGWIKRLEAISAPPPEAPAGFDWKLVCQMCEVVCEKAHCPRCDR